MTKKLLSIIAFSVLFRPSRQSTNPEPPTPEPWPPMNVPYSEEQGLRLSSSDESELTITLELHDGFQFPEFTRAGIAQYQDGVQFGFIECEAIVWGETNLDLTFSDNESWSAGYIYCSEIGNMVFGLADGSYVNTGFYLS